MDRKRHKSGWEKTIEKREKKAKEIKLMKNVPAIDSIFKPEVKQLVLKDVEDEQNMLKMNKKMLKMNKKMLKMNKLN